MKVTLHVVLQALGFIASAGTMLTDFVPLPAKPYVVLAVSAAQGALAWWNHYHTPEGKPIAQ